MRRLQAIAAIFALFGIFALFPCTVFADIGDDIGASEVADHGLGVFAPIDRVLVALMTLPAPATLANGSAAGLLGAGASLVRVPDPIDAVFSDHLLLANVSPANVSPGDGHGAIDCGLDARDGATMAAIGARFLLYAMVEDTEVALAASGGGVNVQFPLDADLLLH